MSNASAPPEEFDEYRLVRQIGRGTMGEVYLAHDRLLDRAVAIKFIAAPDPDDEARERFLVEARAVARLQHPNVLSVFRVSELAGRPYIVAEYLRGHSLDLLPRPVPWPRARELAIGLCRGLAAAHRRGVLHRDVKPTNAFLTEDGTTKLLDFGLAKLLSPAQSTFATPHHAERPPPVAGATLSPEATLPSPARPLPSTDEVTSGANDPRRLTRAGAVLGSPLYMAPESWRGEPASTRADVYSLGALIYELLTGSAPLADHGITEISTAAQSWRPSALVERVDGIDAGFATAVQRCLDPDPAARFPDAQALLAALESGGHPLSASSSDGALSPYRGLMAFDAAHRPLFFGRSDETRDILDRLRADALVVIAGDSGVGKTSLLRAGVLPRIAEGALGGRPPTVLELPQTSSPVRALALTLSQVLRRDEADLEQLLGEDPHAAARLLRLAQTPLLLVADGLEHWLSAPKGAAHTALMAVDVLLGSGGPIRCVATVSSERLSTLSSVPRFGEHAVRSLFLLHPLQGPALREAITRPVSSLGFAFESEEAVERLALQAEPDGSGSPAGAAPMLQLALSELWSSRDEARRIIPDASVEAQGGIGGALTRHAERVLSTFDVDRHEVAKELLLRLVSVDGERVRWDRDALTGTNGARAETLDALCRARIVVGVGGRDEGLQLAHRSLASSWKTLRDWAEGHSDRRMAHARLRRAALEWDRVGRADEALWGARQLRDVELVPMPDRTALETSFVLRSSSATRRRTLRKRAAILGLPLALVIVVSPFAKARYDQQREVEFFRSLTTTALGDAEAATGAEQRRRQEAFTAFDRSAEDAEDLWAAALRASAEADMAWQQVERTLEQGLHRASGDDVLLQTAHRVAWIQHGRARALLRKDALGALEARLAPEARAALAEAGRVIVQTADEAQVFVEQPGATTTEHRWQHLGAAPGPFELDPGVARLKVQVEGRPAVVFPVRVEAGTDVTWDIPVPASVPAGFVYVPPGPFLFGSAGDDSFRRSFFHTQPIHRVRTGGYFIGRHEVTIGAWLQFLDALPADERRRRTPAVRQAFNGLFLEQSRAGAWTLRLSPSTMAYRARAGEPITYADRDRRQTQDWRNFPISAITYDDAVAYARWLDATGRVPGARLCTDHEWERAGRGVDDRVFPHGDVLEVDDANIDLTYGQKPGGFGPDEVGSHPRSVSPYGVEDLSGNVWEWTRGHPAAPASAIRGGCWYQSKLTSTLPNREPLEPNHRDPLIGLRLCADVPSQP